MRKLYGTKFRCKKARAGASKLFYQYVLCLFMRADTWTFTCGVGEIFSGIVYRGGSSVRGRDGETYDHGAVLLCVGVYGLLDRGGEKSGEKLCADGDRDIRSMCVQGDMDIYGVCVFRNDSFAISVVCVFVGNHGDRGQSVSGKGISPGVVSFYLQVDKKMVNCIYMGSLRT